MNQLSEIDNCFRQGLLRKVEPSRSKGDKSIAKAKEWLKEAKLNYDTGAFDSCMASSYLAMFHAARGILFRDGIREKSHYCVARYVENYVNKNLLEEKWVLLLDRVRQVRHLDQYDLSYKATGEEAHSILINVERFVERMDKLLTETKQI